MSWIDFWMASVCESHNASPGGKDDVEERIFVPPEEFADKYLRFIRARNRNHEELVGELSSKGLHRIEVRKSTWAKLA